MTRRPQAFTLVLAVGALTACGVIPAAPGPLQTDFIPQVTSSASASPESASADGFSTEQRLAVRIRVETCNGWATGSGWVLSSNQVITNRHVAEGATRIEVTTYDGHDYEVNSSVIATLPDLALLTLDDVFTEAANVSVVEPRAGIPLTVVGYPLGDALTVEEGTYIDSAADTLGASGADVWLIDAHIEHGSSGSPVYDKNGDVVAIVYAGDDQWDALAWPASWLEDLLADPSGWTDNTAAC